MEKVFGYAPETIEGSFAWWESRIHPEDRPTALKRAHSAIESGGTDYADEYRFGRADGSYAVVEDRALIFRDDTGAAVRVVGTIVDVTQRRELEAQLRHAQRMEAVGQLAGGVAHDFNNMLTAILGFARLLVDEVPEEGEGRDFLDEIVAATDRAGALTRQLLAFSRRQVLQPRSVDLNATIESMQPMLRRLIGENVVIEAKLDPAITSVWADEGQVEQVILNLVVNARDAMQEGGVLRIATVPVPPDQVPAVEGEERLTRPCVRLTVEDTGCGMPPDVLGRIFEPFFTTKGPSAGTGLGLATVYGIVRQSGGHVLVRSEVDVGSTFDIYLPATAPDARGPFDGGAGSDGSSAGRVLIVDDDEELRDLAGRVLRSGGYDVRTAEHGDRALELVRGSFEPDLLLTDVVLPRMDGPRVAARVTELVPGVRTLFMTGYVGHQLAAGSLPGPEMSLLEKPFSAAALLRIVDETLDRPRAALGSLEEVGT
jgi:PAS domain S-box-containing protein